MLPLRALPLAVMLGSATLGRGAEEALPGIFAPRPAVTGPVAPPPPFLRRSGTSDRMSKLIFEQLLARARPFELPAPFFAATGTGFDRTVVMDKMEVLGDKVRVISVGEREPPVQRFLRTGKFFETLDGRMYGDIKLFNVTPVGALPKDDVRVEVGFTLKF